MDAPPDVADPHADGRSADLHEKNDHNEFMFTLADVRPSSWHSDIGDVRLVVVDPIGSFLGGRTDAHRDNEVRSVLAPVNRLAERYGAAVVIVAHRRKGHRHRGRRHGARLKGLHRDRPGRLAPHHRPSGQEPPTAATRKVQSRRQQNGWAFSIVGDPAQLVWEDAPVEMNADEPRRRGPSRTPAPRSDDAKAWLVAVLARQSRRHG
ncbi:MAG: AAA family ATPase [Pirellulales bacterium]